MTEATLPDNAPLPGGIAVKEHSHGLGTAIDDRNRADRPASFDPAEFDVPTGREEEWRFTPLDRLRDLHEGAAADGDAHVQIDAAPEAHVEVVGRDDVRLGKAGAPGDRVAARAWAGF